MSTWFKKYDLITLKNPNFLLEIGKLITDIPQIPPLDLIDAPPDDQRNPDWDQQIVLSNIDFENILQKTLLKMLNILISFFKSEFFVLEHDDSKAFCSQAFAFLTIERKYFLGLWTKQNAVHANFIMNRILSSFIRLLFFFQEFHRFILNNNERLIFIESDPQDIRLSFDNIYAIIDCITLVFTALLQKLSHLKNFLENELNFLLRIYFFLSYFKTCTIPKNLQISRQKFPEKELENLIYLILDTTKTAIVINKGLLSSSKMIELEPEYEEDKTPNIVTTLHYESKDSLQINGASVETPSEKSPMLLNNDSMESVSNVQKLARQRSTNAKIPKLVKNQSVFFDELNEDDEIKEELGENSLSLTVKKGGGSRIRKSLLGDTRNSLIAEMLATSTLNNEDTHKKVSRFAGQLSSTSQPKTEEKDPNVLESNFQARSGIVRNLEFGGANNSFWKYLNTINPSVSVMSPQNDKNSIMNSEIFKKSMNLPMRTVLSTIHPSIMYYKAGHNTGPADEKNDDTSVYSLNNKVNSGTEMVGVNSNGFNANLIKSMSSRKFLNPYEQTMENYYEDVPRKQKFEAINQNLNEGLVKYLLDFGKKEQPVKNEKDDKEALNAKGAKKDAKDKKMNLFVKELEGDSLMNLVTKGDEDSPKNGRRTLSGKKEKELKRQLTDKDKEEEGAQAKHKRKSNRQNTKKLGITEKDLIKIDKNTKIEEKLIYCSVQEKLEDSVPFDEDILVTTLSSEADDIKKKNSVAANSFVKAMLPKEKDNKSVLLKPKDENKAEFAKPHYKMSSGVVIPFFFKREEENSYEMDAKANQIAEEALNDLEVCEEYNEFYVARKKNKKVEGVNTSGLLKSSASSYR